MLTRTLLALPALLLVVSACADGGGADDAGTPEDTVYGGLDKNHDGALDADDADDGTLAIAYVTLDSDGAPDEATAQADASLDATLRPGGSGGWYLEATLPGGELLSLRFTNAEALTVMSGAITNASVNPPEGGDWFAYSGELTQKVEIVEIASDGTTASGALEDEIEIDVYGMNESPTGETLRIKGFGFASIPVNNAQ